MAKLVSAASLLAATGSAQLVVPNLAESMGAAAPLSAEFGDFEGTRSVPAGESGANYVFLQKFPLETAPFFYHTEVLVCPKGGFSAEDQKFLDDKISGMKDFADIDETWWQGKTSDCVELGYGGALCTKECCSVGHDHMALNKRQAVIGNANVKKKSLYIYGTGDFDGSSAFHKACDAKCWSNWSGTDYNPLTNNCNTFTSTVLSCVYGLSQKKPSLGVSDMVTVKGHCPVNQTEVVDNNVVV
eukprot:TRINITY_DN5621_c0_g1_i1.p2 TRINITY_DN5621_c0_g1~~TRINITY_DN5621_c0_g1_i1.p2  ORF type:complete len:263 (-),score=71.50 TRINITY_DN5621_c0_g1_i1:285-1013(-)